MLTHSAHHLSKAENRYAHNVREGHPQLPVALGDADFRAVTENPRKSGQFLVRRRLLTTLAFGPTNVDRRWKRYSTSLSSFPSKCIMDLKKTSWQ